MKCRIQFIGNILLNDLPEDVQIDDLKRFAKESIKKGNFLFSDFRFKIESDNDRHCTVLKSAGEQNEKNKKRN